VGPSFKSIPPEAIAGLATRPNLLALRALYRDAQEDLAAGVITPRRLGEVLADVLSWEEPAGPVPWDYPVRPDGLAYLRFCPEGHLGAFAWALAWWDVRLHYTDLNSRIGWRNLDRTVMAFDGERVEAVLTLLGLPNPGRHFRPIMDAGLEHRFESGVRLPGRLGGPFRGDVLSWR
jgi:hypothetical protein